MRYSLLEIVQEILSSMDSDEVNSISDTVESMQVATLIRGVYYDIATDIGLPEHETLFELNASGDPAKPCLMTVPTNVVTMRNLKYDNKLDTDTYSDWQEVKFLPFEDFLKRVEIFRTYDSDVGEQTISFNGESFPIMYKSDSFPQYYTTADDNQILFDSYNSDVDTTLVKNKTMCMGNVYPTFTLEDAFAPDLDPSQFSLLRNKAKVRAFNELKQQPNEEAALEARRQKVIVQKRKRKTPDEAEVFKVPRYGRY
mgnify:CR=1 FL=1